MQMVACHGRSLLCGEKPTQVLGACHAGALCVRVEGCDNVVGDIPNEDIGHGPHDIALSAPRGAVHRRHVPSAVTAIGFSGYAWRRSHGRGEANRVARLCTIGCGALIVLLVAGSAVYAAN